ncbi:MAG: metallophosphoesterase [Nanoarchaeota archaeon]|nr:metallophosphoesterase [Nanoarchaeota archaeon]
MGFIEECSSKGFLVSEGVDFSRVNSQDFIKYVLDLKEKPFVINQELIDGFKNNNSFFGKNLPENHSVEVSSPVLRDKGLSRVEVIKSYNLNNKLRSMNDWFDFYLNRFNRMKKLLENRNGLRNATSIASISKMSGKNEVSTIGLVKDIRKTNNGNYMIELEDPTGLINIFVGTSKTELIKQCEDLVLDEVIGVVGSTGTNFLYVSELVFPEVPDNPVKYGPVDEYACFIADTHVGSTDFEPKMFENFTNWLRGGCGTNEQKETAKKVKYLFIIGDLVDGVGVYPSQSSELTIKDIYKQYEVFSDYLKGLPEDMQLIFIPGNHDALRQNEPQPPLFSDIAKPVFELSNAKNLSNPSVVNIGKYSNFNGFNVFLYHGYSYTYYANNVPNLLNVGMDRPEQVGEFLLRKRHLAPTHSSSLITPEMVDPFIIDAVPDILATGHLHKLGYKMYRGINILGTSCFQKMTSYMQKLGHHPTPGFVPLINLKTRNVKIMNFT